MPFLDDWEIIDDVDVILPVPSTRVRNYQPAVEIAYAIANYLNIHFSEDILVKTSNVESKNMTKSDKKLKGTIVATKKATRKHNILLVDDLYSTGETLKECVNVLRKDPLLKKIFVLTMTKTR